MATTAIAERPMLDPTVVQQVLLSGDLSKLTPEQRISYYNRVCDSLGLNPLTQPFAYIRLSGKEVLYAKKDATDQLRFKHNISIDIKAREVIEGVYVVTAGASMPNGRRDESTGAVPIDGLKGEARANAMLKSETKSKRRVTLSICGLGMLDETEIESIVPRPPVIIEAPQDKPALPESATAIGAVYIERVEPADGGRWGKVILGDGRELVVNQEQLITLATEVAQDATPVLLETRQVKKRGSNPPEYYERIEGIQRAVTATKPEVEAPQPAAEDVLF